MSGPEYNPNDDDPDAVQAIRNAALDDAAKVCDQVVDDYRNRRTTPKWTAQEAARRIRLLIKWLGEGA